MFNTVIWYIEKTKGLFYNHEISVDNMKINIEMKVKFMI